MSDLVTQGEKPVSAETLEHVLATGDLSKLSVPQRLEYYSATCKSLGLNPLTKPMRFLSFQGQIQLYFTRDGTDQLRATRGITLHVVDKTIDAGIYSVTVRAKDKTGREDEDIGAVAMPAGGESRANALMKCITKAKRRVTLSICGLGHTDESELDTMPGAMTFDPDEEIPVAPIRTVPDKKVSADVVRQPAWQIWIDKLQGALAPMATVAAVDELSERPTIITARKHAPQWANDEADALFAEARTRCAGYEASETKPDDDGLPPSWGRTRS